MIIAFPFFDRAVDEFGRQQVARRLRLVPGPSNNQRPAASRSGDGSGRSFSFRGQGLRRITINATRFRFANEPPTSDRLA